MTCCEKCKDTPWEPYHISTCGCHGVVPDGARLTKITYEKPRTEKNPPN